MECGQQEGCVLPGVYPRVPTGGYKQNAPPSGPPFPSPTGIGGKNTAGLQGSRSAACGQPACPPALGAPAQSRPGQGQCALWHVAHGHAHTTGHPRTRVPGGAGWAPGFWLRSPRGCPVLRRSPRLSQRMVTALPLSERRHPVPVPSALPGPGRVSASRGKLVAIVTPLTGQEAEARGGQVLRPGGGEAWSWEPGSDPGPLGPFLGPCGWTVGAAVRPSASTPTFQSNPGSSDSGLFCALDVARGRAGLPDVCPARWPRALGPEGPPLA